MKTGVRKQQVRAAKQVSGFIISTPLDADTVARLDIYCQNIGRRRSQVLRDLVREFLDEHDSDSENGNLLQSRNGP